MTSIFLLALNAMALVPGNITVVNQNPASTYCPGSKITFKITYTDVPLSDPLLGATFTHAEVRGNRPDTRPRGFIALGMPERNLQEFQTQGGTYEYTIPADYAGYTYYFMPNAYYAQEAGTSTNFMNRGSSEAINLIDCTSSASPTIRSISTSIVTSPLSTGAIATFVVGTPSNPTGTIPVSSPKPNSATTLDSIFGMLSIAFLF